MIYENLFDAISKEQKGFDQFCNIPIAQIEFVQFLMKNGFLKLALSLTDCLLDTQLKGALSCPKDVVKCTQGIIYLEGVGQGNEARKHFEQTLKINPVYPQAARLASTYAIHYNDAVNYNNMFINSMSKCLANSTNKDGFPRFGAHDNMQYAHEKGTARTIQEDLLAYHSSFYYQMQEQKNVAKQLAFGSLVTEIIRSGNEKHTLIPEDIQMGIVRNNIELGIVWANSIAAKQKEYAQFTLPKDNLVLQNTVNQATFYLDHYDPYDVIAINWKASCLFHLGKYEECIDQCNFAIQIQPTGYYFHYLNKALALTHLGQKNEVAALIPIINKESGNTSISDMVLSASKQCKTIEETKEFFYHYIEGAAYAAKEELLECENSNRIVYMNDFINKLNYGNSYSIDDILLLTTFYTPLLIYYYINKKAIYSNKKFLNTLIDMAESVSHGFLGEMVSELCWTFALSYKDYDYFTPLREKLIDNFRNETIALAIQRIEPPLYDILQSGCSVE